MSNNDFNPIELDEKNKTFPIINEAACLYKWAWSTLFLSRGTTASCHRGRHWRLNEDNFMDFHNHHGKLADREKMASGDWPGNGCEYCKDIENAGGVSDRTGFVNKSIEMLPPEFEGYVQRAFDLDNVPLKVSPTLVEVYFNNVCNQSCVYCTPGFSSQIEQEVRKFGPSEFNEEYSNWRPEPKYEKFKAKFWEWMEKESDHLQILQVLGGEPLYQKEFEQCLDFFDKHPRPNLVYRIFSNLKHDPEKFKIKIQRVQDLIDQNKLKSMEFVCSIDCWGPEIEYVRDGINLVEWEKNFNILLDAPTVGMQIHATLTALTLPTLYQLIEKTNEWRKIKDSLRFDWNTVVSPSIFNPYYFGKYLTSFIDNAIQALEDFSDIVQREQLQTSLRSIQAQLLATPVNKKEVNGLSNFLDDLDQRRKRNWKIIFPQIVDIINIINNDEPESKWSKLVSDINDGVVIRALSPNGKNANEKNINSW